MVSSLRRRTFEHIEKVQSNYFLNINLVHCLNVEIDLTGRKLKILSTIIIGIVERKRPEGTASLLNNRKRASEKQKKQDCLFHSLIISIGL